MLLPGTRVFADPNAYRGRAEWWRHLRRYWPRIAHFVDEIVRPRNENNRKRIELERTAVRALPQWRTTPGDVIGRLCPRRVC